MDEYIKRKPLIEEISSLSVTLCGNEIFGTLAKHSVVKTIYEQPAADVAEVRHGEWITDAEDLAWGNAIKRKHCSECGGRPHWDNDERKFILAEFCHHCGAKMDGKRKDGAE